MNLFTEPKNLELAKANVKFEVLEKSGTVHVKVSTDNIALFVTLTTLAAGRFEDNCFLLENEKTVEFIPFGKMDLDLLKSSLRVEHV